MIAAEARVQLEIALDRLDPRCAEFLRFLFFGATTPSYEQICAEFGLAIGSVGPIRGRCLERLRQILEETYGQ
ncbi:MAG: hypothetical protein R3E97_23740 [Candidatus Eisenbacteria bacterium]